MLAAGSRLGPYEIVSPLGAGGMGEVYRARDTRLDRSVAVKVLPAELAGSAQFRLRFEREAKAISQLSHPHICTLYDVGENYLVMELLDGESLADRLSRGALPIEQVMQYGIQIADALERAHRAGIVHRDLKPGNVMITKSGAKLLDFGLAKRSSLGIDPHAATAVNDRALTSEGMIVGTFQYMAPEQLEGADADVRTDIFALGTLLYEMATGRRAFAGKTRTSLIAAIVGSEPPRVSEIRPLTPPALEHVIADCLKKDPDERWQSAHDVKRELEWIREGARLDAPKKRSAKWIAAAAILLAVASAIAGALVLRTREAPRVERTSIGLPHAARYYRVDNRGIAISPDGDRIVYVGTAGDDTQLYLLRRNQFDPVALPGTRNATSPFFSDDGGWIGFSRGSRVWKLRDVPGAAPQPICETFFVVGAAWHGDTIYFAPNFNSGIWSVPAAGGTRKLILAPRTNKKELAYLWPQMLPDGKSLLLSIWKGGHPDESDVGVLSLETRDITMVLHGGYSARYSSTGHLLYVRSGVLYAVRFDPKTRQTSGVALPVVQGVASGYNTYEAHYALSDDGTLAYVPGTLTGPKRSLVWRMPDGTTRDVPVAPRGYDSLNVMPDGKSVLMMLEESTYNVWLLDLERDLLTRLTFSGDDNRPVVSPDGTQFAFMKGAENGVIQTFVASVDGGPPRQVTRCAENCLPDSWLRDGSGLLISTSKGDDTDISLVRFDRPGVTEPVVSTPFSEWKGLLAPNGQWLAYASMESGDPEIYVRRYPRGAKMRVSTSGVQHAFWSRDGRHLYLADKSGITVVDVEPRGETLVLGKPRPFAAGRYSEGSALPDGRVLLIRPDLESNREPAIRRIDHFDVELERRVP